MQTLGRLSCCEPLLINPVFCLVAAPSMMKQMELERAILTAQTTVL